MVIGSGSSAPDSPARTPTKATGRQAASGGEDDLDAVLYDDTGGETTLGFGSEQAMGLSMASARHPETGTWDLAAGTPYLFEVGNWSGEPGTAWTLAFDVMPGAFPD